MTKWKNTANKKMKNTKPRSEHKTKETIYKWKQNENNKWGPTKNEKHGNKMKKQKTRSKAKRKTWKTKWTKKEVQERNEHGEWQRQENKRKTNHVWDLLLCLKSSYNHSQSMIPSAPLTEISWCFPYPFGDTLSHAYWCYKPRICLSVVTCVICKTSAGKETTNVT